MASAKKAAAGKTRAKKTAAGSVKRASKRFKIKRFEASKTESGKSLLAEMREKRAVSQKRLAVAVGVSLRTIRRIENGAIDDPGVRVLHNCAIALGCELEQILPDEWLLWTQFSEETPGPPEWESFFEVWAEDLKVNPPYDFAEANAEWVEKRRERLAERNRKRFGL